MGESRVDLGQLSRNLDKLLFRTFGPSYLRFRMSTQQRFLAAVAWTPTLRCHPAFRLPSPQHHFRIPTARHAQLFRSIPPTNSLLTHDFSNLQVRNVSSAVSATLSCSLSCYSRKPAHLSADLTPHSPQITWDLSFSGPAIRFIALHGRRHIILAATEVHGAA